MNNRYEEILQALGGPANLPQIDACISRLRATVQDTKLVNEAVLKSLGAEDVIVAGNNVQSIFGAESDHIREEIQKLIGSNPAVKINRQIILGSPLSGKVLNLTEVPDKVFSEKILGDGFAIDPSEGKVLSPVDGTIVNVFKTGHALGLETETGVEILIHVGIDTVKMNGDGFEALVQYGQKVKVGQELIRFDLEKVRSQATSTISPVVITNMDRVLQIHKKGLETAQAGQEIVSLELNI